MKFSFFKSKKQTHERPPAELNSNPASLPSTPPLVPSHPKGTHSPSHSISSASTQSSTHSLYPQRGIFRTLEPVWSYLPDQHDQWIPLAPQNQRVLEHAFATRQSTCTIPLPYAPHTTVHLFASQEPITKKRRPVTQFFSSPNQPPQQMRSSPNLSVPRDDHRHKTPGMEGVPNLPGGKELYLHQNLRRALVPYWWFEQDNEQGGKGMCKFDYKNQVRLEALSDGRSTLTLTDASFPVPFQVILEQTDRSLREECCGFMYLNTQLIIEQDMYLSKPNPFPLQSNDEGLYHDAFLNRRCSV
ncbi:hypothetical protein BC941DRAFT_439951 [Chlamydoabsidia padenii]|nr:hypothetical protein BC941DRAFT_439951 [Chlamydoabsidia padenii]